MSSWSNGIIEEFLANAGSVGGGFAGKPLLLLHHTGAKSGTERVAPLMYHADNGHVYIFASKGGAPSHPDWYHNLKAHPAVTFEIGVETRATTAIEAIEVDRDGVYKQRAANFPQSAEYQAATARTIPVFRLGG